MKKAVHKILSLVMAALLLLSTVSWTIEKHTCMGRVMDVALFAKADDCGMYAAMQAMGDDTLENPCCGDEVLTLQGQDDLKISFNDISLDQQIFLVAFTHAYVTLFTALEQRTSINEYYPPPHIVKDIQLLDETFLI
ncbi:hypothetical protein ACFQZJ_15035 [Maribacter chungangensis]|uniref:Uncharacterized protein n=1 Tax=Maribacter chungangensis TaxID=1069117 RepID=A0ABW3B7T2_9FLAO